MSDEDFDWGAASEWLNRHNGYASGFHYRNRDERAFVEHYVAREWCKAMRREFGVAIEALDCNPSDPPDFYVSIAGEPIGLEVVQFVSQDNLARAARNESPYQGRLFGDCQWTQAAFKQKLTDILEDKGSKYRDRGIVIDILLVMVVEPWLGHDEAAAWMHDFNAPRHESIKAACLLFDYSPGRGTDTWPLHWIYGERWPCVAG